MIICGNFWLVLLAVISLFSLGAYIGKNKELSNLEFGLKLICKTNKNSKTLLIFYLIILYKI